MRSYLFIPLAAVLAASPAFAQDQAAQDQSIQVFGTQPAYKLQPQQMAEIAGVYRFDNGGVFRLTKVNNRLMAQLGDRGATELVARADNRFVSTDQRMTVEYLPQAFGDQITLSYPSDLAKADSPMVTVRFAVN